MLGPWSEEWIREMGGTLLERKDSAIIIQLSCSPDLARDAIARFFMRSLLPIGARASFVVKPNLDREPQCALRMALSVFRHLVQTLQTRGWMMRIEPDASQDGLWWYHADHPGQCTLLAAWLHVWKPCRPEPWFKDPDIILTPVPRWMGVPFQIYQELCDDLIRNGWTPTRFLSNESMDGQYWYCNQRNETHAIWNAWPLSRQPKATP